MTMEVETYRGNEVVQKTFEKKLCQEAMDVVQHTKMMPECKNVTKQNCITKWETDEDGNQASNFNFLFSILMTDRTMYDFHDPTDTKYIAGL